jgi:hypothetical protein
LKRSLVKPLCLEDSASPLGKGRRKKVINKIVKKIL